MPLSPGTFDALTDKHYIKKLVEQFFFRSVFWMKLRKGEKTFPGGRSITQPISYVPNTQAGTWAGGVGVLSSDFVDHATRATWNLAHYYAPCVLPMTEQLLNEGEAKIASLLESQMELMNDSFLDKMGQAAYGDGSNDSLGNKTLDGLQSIIKYNSGTYAGISRASSTGTKSSYTNQAWWNANTYAVNANTSINFWKGAETIGKTTTLSVAKMQQLFGLCTDGAEKPTLGIGSQLIFNAYYNLCQAQQRIVNDDDVGKLGFQGLEFNGIPLVVDDLVNAAGTLYFVNMNHIQLRPAKGINFLTTEFRQPPNQFVQIKYLFWTGNIVCDKPRLQGAMTGITG